jgi:hypothetical protein
MIEGFHHQLICTNFLFNLTSIHLSLFLFYAATARIKVSVHIYISDLDLIVNCRAHIYPHLVIPPICAYLVCQTCILTGEIYCAMLF